MPKTLRQKTITFTIEFEKPDRDEVVERVPCRYCKAKIGERCATQRWGGAWSGGPRGGNKMSDLHQDRYAEFMNLETVHSGMLYRIKG